MHGIGQYNEGSTNPLGHRQANSHFSPWLLPLWRSIIQRIADLCLKDPICVEDFHLTLT